MTKEMPRKVENKDGVTVKINRSNANKIIKIIRKTKRTFVAETNVAVEEYDPKVVYRRDDGR